jgi:hypothetical protein
MCVMAVCLDLRVLSGLSAPLRIAHVCVSVSCTRVCVS